jgi:antitoxin component HigA of HigAB toxin-antitoxin module
MEGMSVLTASPDYLEHGLLQKDLIEVFGTPSMVSEVLNGKGKLNKDHSKRLAAF